MHSGHHFRSEVTFHTLWYDFNMRRVFIIRKDLNLKPGKLAAMVSHCAEAYWTNLLKRNFKQANEDGLFEAFDGCYRFPVEVDSDIWDEYVNSIFTKTICECKNKEALQKAVDAANAANLVEGEDWGFINDRCLTDLTPENADGTCTIGIWFKPLADDIAHTISKKFKLYGVFDDKKTMRCWSVTCRDEHDAEHEVGVMCATADDAMKSAEKTLCEGKHIAAKAIAVKFVEKI